MEERKLTATISMSRKINLGKYESADVFISISNITEDTEQDDVIALLDAPVKSTFEVLKTRLAAQVAVARQGGVQ